MKKIKLNI